MFDIAQTTITKAGVVNRRKRTLLNECVLLLPLLHRLLREGFIDIHQVASERINVFLEFGSTFCCRAVVIAVCSDARGLVVIIVFLGVQ